MWFHIQAVGIDIRGGRNHFFRLRLPSCPKFLNPGAAIFQTWESDSCSDSGYNHRSNRNLPMFFLKKSSHRLLLLTKLKSDYGSGSGFSQIFDPDPQHPGSGATSDRHPIRRWSPCNTSFTRMVRLMVQLQSVAYAENFHGGWFRVIWWSFVFGVRCLWRHNLTSFPCFQTNVLATFLDIIMHIFLHLLP